MGQLPSGLKESDMNSVKHYRQPFSGDPDESKNPVSAESDPLFKVHAELIGLPEYFLIAKPFVLRFPSLFELSEETSQLCILDRGKCASSKALPPHFTFRAAAKVRACSATPSPTHQALPGLVGLRMEHDDRQNNPQHLPLLLVLTEHEKAVSEHTIDTLIDQLNEETG